MEAYLAEMEAVGGKEFAASLRGLIEADAVDGGDRLGAALAWMEQDHTRTLRNRIALVKK
jgi:hypothetical protein